MNENKCMLIGIGRTVRTEMLHILCLNVCSEAGSTGVQMAQPNLFWGRDMHKGGVSNPLQTFTGLIQAPKCLPLYNP